MNKNSSYNFTGVWLSAMHCLLWVDYVEAQEGQSGIGLVIFVNCIATILTNILLLIVIVSHRESKDQVTSSLLTSSSFFEQRCNMFMLSIGCSDVLFALDLLIFNQPGLNYGR